MTEDEFKRWCNELGKMLPDTYTWMQKNRESVGHWYTELFKDLEYDICMSIAHTLWMEGFQAYERERIPAIVVKRHGEILWKRHQDQQKAKERKRRNEGDGTFYGDPVMVHAFQEARKLNHNPAVRSAFVDQLIEKESAAIQTAEEFEQQCQW